jgi:UDP-N-acetylmuramate--alanine ligase
MSTPKPPRRRAPRLDELDSTRPVHLAGVAGAAMSGVAALLKSRGIPVVGTDSSPDPTVRRRLAESGIEIHQRQDGSRIREGTQLLVASAALPGDHAELRAARGRGIPVVRYAELLGSIVNHAEGIAVAGTHGKTTTSAMIVWALGRAGRAPGFLIGGYVPQLGASSGAGGSRIFVAEACEYDRSFLNLEPQRAVINNVGADHLDVYDDLAGVQGAFAEFAARIRPSGVLVYPSEDPSLEPIVARARCETVSFSCGAPADYEAREVRADAERTRFELAIGGRASGEIGLRLPGIHNVHNALAAIAICRDLGLSIAEIAPALESFTGVARRFERVGEIDGVTVIDDYAHHPTEIRALLEGAATRYPGRRLVMVFQPHQISRTRALSDEFCKAFDAADLLVITDIYAARDNGVDRAARSTQDLAARIAGTGTTVAHAPDFPTALEFLLQRTAPGDVVLTVGAGDIYLLAADLLRALDRRNRTVQQ